ncbi:YbhB/YbcL family Raf kinase inhibitor-like protein [Psychromonas sp.]|uniref:YbhB/YbcL family Raf kinase inhibitor-like protein n=1 Tax=Psychromonas sp. TaxID=1884585 RepID=UPI003564E763
MTLTLQSSAFTGGGEIPRKYTCEAQNISPPLSWQGAPEGTRSLVLIVDDPDAPDPNAPKMTWVHWLVYNIPPETTALIEGAGADSLPVGALQGVNDWKKAAYGGPCPPIGRHRYFHKLYALDTVLMLSNNPTKSELEKAFKGHVIAQTELIGTYEKSK